MPHFVFNNGVLQRVDDGPSPTEKKEEKPKKKSKRTKAQDLSVLTDNKEEAGEDPTPTE